MLTLRNVRYRSACRAVARASQWRWRDRSRAPEARTVLFLSPTASLATIEASRCTPESSKVCTDDELRSITMEG